MRKTNCKVNGKAMYRIRTRIGSDITGKAIYKNFYGIGKKEAEEKYNSYIEAKVNLQSPTLIRSYSMRISLRERLNCTRGSTANCLPCRICR